MPMERRVLGKRSGVAEDMPALLGGDGKVTVESVRKLSNSCWNGGGSSREDLPARQVHAPPEVQTNQNKYLHLAPLH